MARKRSPARLVIALSIAAVLAVFLLYTSIAGGYAVGPAQPAPGQTGTVSLVGRVVGKPTGDAHAGGLRFRLRDVKDPAGGTVAVVYTGSVPDLFATGRDIVVDGQLVNGTFVAKPGSMVTKCPSKYSAKPASELDDRARPRGARRHAGPRGLRDRRRLLRRRAGGAGGSPLGSERAHRGVRLDARRRRVLASAFERDDFSLTYVADHSNRSLSGSTSCPPSGVGRRARCSSGSSS